MKRKAIMTINSILLAVFVVLAIWGVVVEFTLLLNFERAIVIMASSVFVGLLHISIDVYLDCKK